MIAAIYARKSTEQNGVADGEKSVTRQLHQARAFATRKGWTIAEDHVYVDDGISGAEFARRPGPVALLNTLKPRAPFDVLLLYGADRLGREQVETAYVMKQISQAGVRIYEAKGGGRELALDSPIDKMVMSVLAGAAEIERAKARERTRDALQRKAERGHVTGGKCFGYDNVAMTDAAGWRSHVVRTINESEAAVVRRILILAAEGLGLRKLAHRLNDEGAPAPTPRRAGGPRGWAPSSIREILYRQLYHGVIVWGRKRKRDQWGQYRVTPRDEAEWIRRRDESLRVVSEQLWAAAHARLGSIRQIYLCGTAGRLWGRPANGIDS